MDRGFARLVVAAVFASLIGCGARTDPFDDAGSSAGGASAGRGQGGASAGAAGSHRAGAPGAGAPQGGAPQAGAAPVAGAPQGGAPQGGAPQGGAAPVAGAGFGGITGVAGGGPIVDACVALAPSTCGKCLCQSCSSEVVACFSDLGCALIFACVEQTGCQGLGCYAAGTCRGVIDNAGGLTGRSVNNVFSILSCAVTSQSACLCN